MKTNIVFISLVEDFSKKLAEKISKDYDLYFADMNDILEYNLMNEKEIGNICGIDYLNSLKNKIVKSIASYENTMITLPYYLFINENNSKILKQYGTVVFLKFNKVDCENITNSDNESKVNNITFDEYSSLCESESDVCIHLDNLDFNDCYKKVKKTIDEYFL